MYVEYGYGVVEWMWENAVLVGVSNGVVSYRAVIGDDRSEVCWVSCDIDVMGGCGEDGLLEYLYDLRFCMHPACIG